MISRLRRWLVEYRKMARVFRQTLYGIWRLFSIPDPKVTIFGSARLEPDDTYAKQAHELGGKFVSNGISVITGGGPGIMEAVSCGAMKNGAGNAVSIGIGVKELDEGKNPCVQEYIELDYFFARKWLLTRYSTAFVVFPGGFGTLDELGEVLTLIQTEKLPRVPIVLIGKEYWHLLMQWFEKEALTHETIAEKDLKLFTVTDDIGEVYSIVYEFCKKVKKERQLKQ